VFTERYGLDLTLSLYIYSRL
jgi:hypothetical protein